MAKILIIDDEPYMRELLSRVLMRNGHTVVVAAEGSEGERYFAKDPADLIITDLMMPGQDGIETITRMRRDRPEVGIIAMSGGLRDVPLLAEGGAISRGEDGVGQAV